MDSLIPDDDLEGPAGPDPVERIAESFLSRRRRGERPTLSEYIARYPDHADDIRDLFPALELMEELGSDDDPLDGSFGDPLGDLLEDAEAPGGVGAASPSPRLGEYRLLRVIGRGGMGVVYEAEQISLGRRVAIKVLGSRSLVSPSHLERFRREARAAARLHHPNIVPVFGVGEDRGVHYYVMQFIDGHGLDEVVREAQRLREEMRERGSPARSEAPLSSTSILSPGSDPAAGSTSSSSWVLYFRGVATIGRDVAAALAYAHEEGVVHRDIKPSNLMLDPQHHTWVTDFGLAKDDSDDALTETGDVVGTVAYMAPERFDGWSDQRSDVYGLGLTLWELVAMRPAFADRNRRRLIRKVTEEEPTALRKLEPRVPRDLETIIHKAMRKDPADRYQTVARMQADLERFLDGRPIDAQRVSSVERALRWCRRNRIVASLTLALVVVLAVAALGAVIAAWKLERRLLTSYLDQAGAHLASRSPGGASEALRAVELAAELEPGDSAVLQLRRLAASALARTDFRPDGRVEMSADARRVFIDDGATRCVELWRDGMLVVRRFPDGRTLRRLESPGKPLDFARFGRNHIAASAVGWTADVFVWDLQRGDIVLRAENAVYDQSYGFSPDGRYLATSDSGGALVFHELSTGDRQVRYQGRSRPRETLFQPRGDLVAMTSGAFVDIVDPSAGRIVSSIVCPAKVGNCAWSESGDLLAIPSANGEVRVVSAVDGVELSVLESPDGAPSRGARFVAGTNLLLTTDTRARLWRWTTGRELLPFRGYSPEVDLDGRVATRLGHYAIELSQIVPARICREFGVSRDRGKRMREIAIDPEDRFLACGVDDGLRVWDLGSSREAAFLPIGVTNGVGFTDDGRRLVSSGDRGLFVWPLDRDASGERLRVGPPRRLGDLASLAQLEIDPSGQFVAVSHGQAVRIVTLDDGEVRTSVSFPHFSSASFGAEGRTFVTGNWQGEDVHLWDTTSGELLWTYPLPSHASARFGPDGRWLAVSSGRRVDFIDAESRTRRYEIQNRTGSNLPGTIAWSPDGLVALGVDRGTVMLVEAASGRELVTLELPVHERPDHLRFSSMGRWLVAAVDGICFVHDLAGLRAELKKLGIDWDRPPFVSTEAGEAVPIAVEVDLGELGGVTEPRARSIDPPPDSRVLVASSALWRISRGEAAPSSGIAWTQPDFDDSRWTPARAGFGYGDADDVTLLADMRGRYSTLYARVRFAVEESGALERLLLRVRSDDGLVAWLNGVEVARLRAGDSGTPVRHDALASGFGPEPTPLEEIEISSSALVKGDNVLAIVGLNQSLSSSDFTLQVTLVAAAD